MRAPARALLVALALVGCAASAPAAAGAATGASIHASFLPDRLGASTAFTFAARLSEQGEGVAGEEGVPAPVRTIVVHLPAGLGIDVRGVGTCTGARLRRAGAAACPSASLVGRGRATLEVHAGSETIPEQATLWAFRGPSVGGHLTLEVLSQGSTPLDERTVSSGVMQADSPPYGSKLTVSIPPIPTLMYEPDASIVSFSLTVGNPRAKAGTGGITVPRSCPAGGFPFAATFTFAGQSSASSAADAPCP
jgi:hypothetical protein